MATFTYSARPATGGDIKSGEIDLPTKDDVLAFLHKQKMIPVSVREKQKQIAFKIGSGVSTKDIVIFTRQFATMINSGLPLVQSLDILAEQTENVWLRKTIQEVLYDVESGHTLADAMGKHPKVFTDLFTNMVAAGEAGWYPGHDLATSRHLPREERRAGTEDQGRDGVPGCDFFSVAGGAICILLIFVIPTFQTMFDSAGIPLPLPTRVVIGMSQFLQSFWWLLIVAIIGSIFGIRAAYASSGGRLLIDRIMLNLPVLGDLQRKAAVARFTRTLGTLVSSGVSILEGLEITAKTAGNRVIHDAVMGSRASIAGGETIAGPLKESGVFPPMVVQMINVGEQTGGLDEMLTKIADFYDEEVDQAVEVLLKAMEPIMIVVLGVIVGGMIVAMYLPIFDMINAVK